MTSKQSRNPINGFRYPEETEVDYAKALTDIKNQVKNEIELTWYHVYRKRWYGESLFCICTEVKELESVVLCSIKGKVIAVLPFKDFSCAIDLEAQLEII
jgi:hypothetical protein